MFLASWDGIFLFYNLMDLLNEHQKFFAGELLQF